MGIIFTDSFEGADEDQALKWTTWNTGRTTGARTGNRCMNYSSYQSGVNASHILPTADEDDLLVIGCAIKIIDGSGSGGGFGNAGIPFMAFRSDAGTIYHVAVTIHGGKIRVVLGYPESGATLPIIGDSVPVLTQFGVWYYVEAKVRLHATNGTVDIRVDETNVLSVTGATTKNAGTKTVFDSFSLHTSYGISGGTRTPNNLDDLYVCNEQGSVNNNFLGAVRIENLRPSANGASSQGVGSDGNSVDNYALVSSPGSSSGLALADWVDLAGTGDQDTYTCDDSVQSPARAVKGVMVWSLAQKTDAGTRKLGLVARLGASESVAATANSTTHNDGLTNGVFQAMRGVFETKPGGGAWTVADVNAAEFGAKATT